MKNLSMNTIDQKYQYQDSMSTRTYVLEKISTSVPLTIVLDLDIIKVRIN